MTFCPCLVYQHYGNIHSASTALLLPRRVKSDVPLNLVRCDVTTKGHRSSFGNTAMNMLFEVFHRSESYSDEEVSHYQTGYLREYYKGKANHHLTCCLRSNFTLSRITNMVIENPDPPARTPMIKPWRVFFKT